MTTPVEEPLAMAVVCRTCAFIVWQGNETVEPDGQALLTAYADSIPGTVCPSKVDPCPHKAAARAAAATQRPVKQAELDILKSRIAALEGRVNRP